MQPATPFVSSNGSKWLNYNNDLVPRVAKALPCGEGLGVGVVRFAHSWRHCHRTAPPPSPPLPQPAAGLPASGRYKSDQTPASRGLVAGGSRPSLLLALIHRIVPCSFVALAALAPDVAQAAVGIDGAALRWPWALPFVGI